MAQRVHHRVHGELACHAQVSAQHGHIGHLGALELVCNVVAAHADRADVRARGLHIDQRFVIEQQAAAHHVLFKGFHAGAVHGDDHVRRFHLGGTDAVVRNHHGAIRAAAAHFGAIRGHPGNLLALQHAGVGQQLAHQQNALPAEPGDNELLFHMFSPRVRTMRRYRGTRPADIAGSCSFPAIWRLPAA